MKLIWNDNHIINIWRFRSPILIINLLDINLCHNSKKNVDKTTLRFQIFFIDNVFVFMEIFPFDCYCDKIFHNNYYLLGFFIYVVPPPPTIILLVDCHMDIATWLTLWNKKNDMLKFFVKQYFSNTNKIVLKYFLLLLLTCS